MKIANTRQYTFYIHYNTVYIIDTTTASAAYLLYYLYRGVVFALDDQSVDAIW